MPPCPICAPHFFFSLREKKKRAAPGAKEKEGLGCRSRWTRAPTSWFLYYVVSVCKFGANQNAPPFSFRCRSPGAHENPVRVLRAPSERADGDAEASQVCTKRHRACRFAEESLIEARYWLSLHQSLFFSYTVHGAPLLLTEKKRRGVHDGQDGKLMPCWRKK